MDRKLAPHAAIRDFAKFSRRGVRSRWVASHPVALATAPGIVLPEVGIFFGITDADRKSSQWLTRKCLIVAKCGEALYAKGAKAEEVFPMPIFRHDRQSVHRIASKFR